MKRNTQQPTVTFQNPNVSSSAEGCEEVDYVNVAVSAEDNLSAILDEKPRSLTQSVPTIAVSWVILSVILALDIYFTSVISENNTKLTEQNQELKTENKELKTHSNDLRQQQQQIQDKETEWIQSNVSRAQWSIDAYCPIGIKGRQCKPCQAGWLFNKSSCYIFGNPPPNEWQTWTEAREDCRRRGSDLVVIADQTEKTYVNDKSFKPNGFWIGLRAVDGKWKWVDGSDLNEDLWGQAAVEGQCAILFKNQRWRSVSCSKRHQWVCGHTALSVK